MTDKVISARIRSTQELFNNLPDYIRRDSAFLAEYPLGKLLESNNPIDLAKRLVSEYRKPTSK